METEPELWLYSVKHPTDNPWRFFVVAESLPAAVAKTAKYYKSFPWNDGRGFAFTAVCPLSELTEGAEAIVT